MAGQAVNGLNQFTVGLDPQTIRTIFLGCSTVIRDGGQKYCMSVSRKLGSVPAMERVLDPADVRGRGGK